MEDMYTPRRWHLAESRSAKAQRQAAIVVTIPGFHAGAGLLVMDGLHTGGKRPGNDFHGLSLRMRDIPGCALRRLAFVPGRRDEPVMEASARVPNVFRLDPAAPDACSQSGQPLR